MYASDQPLIAQQAQADENTAYNALAALPSTANEIGIVLGTGGTVSTLLPASTGEPTQRSSIKSSVVTSNPANGGHPKTGQ